MTEEALFKEPSLANMAKAFEWSQNQQTQRKKAKSKKSSIKSCRFVFKGT
ncbi:hypothetical protein HBZS_102550 [Helicobacter bizzozeronii CCUG 35545]|nr:hypothetical protein HBZS_102550 [Helicobacter bizzozeronii CCUG 35545]